MSNEPLTVFAGLNQVSAGLNRFKSRVAETGFCRQKPNPGTGCFIASCTHMTTEGIKGVMYACTSVVLRDVCNTCAHI